MTSTKNSASTTQEKFLRSNANRMSVKEMSGALNVTVNSIYEWLKELKIVRTRKAGNRKTIFAPTKSKFFNPYEMDDWLTGSSFKPRQSKRYFSK